MVSKNDIILSIRRDTKVGPWQDLPNDTMGRYIDW